MYVAVLAMSLMQERSNFIGKQILPEIKVLSKHLKKSDVADFAGIVKIAEEMLTTSNPSKEQFDKISSHIDSNVLQVMYPGVLTLLSHALRLPHHKLKKADFVQDLKELNIPESHHAPLVKVLFGESRPALDECVLVRRPRFSAIEEFRWRVDVGISTSSLKRVLEPSVLCNIRTSNDKNCTFEVTKEKFHELRYAVAEVLNHMQQLEKRSILSVET